MDPHALMTGQYPLPTCPVQWPNNYDLSLVNQSIKDMFLQFPLYDFYSLIVDPAKVDKLYLEDLNKSYRKFEFRMFIEVNPSEKNLERFGIDERRELLVWIPTIVLQEAGIMAKAGDIITLAYPDYKGKVEFIAMEKKDAEWWGQTGYPVYTTLAMNRRYLSMRQDVRVDQTTNIPPSNDYYDKKQVEETDTDNLFL